MSDMWTTEWPREAGWYWVSHVSVRGREEAPRLEPCLVRVASNGKSPFYVASGAFLFKSETVYAQWQKMVVPDAPAREATR